MRSRIRPRGGKNVEIERLLGRIESDAQPILTKLRERGTLDATERRNFSLFIAFLRTRVPEFHEFVEELYSKGTKSMLRLMATHEGAVEHMIANVLNSEGVSVEAMRDFIERGEYDLRISRQTSLISDRGDLRLPAGAAFPPSTLGGQRARRRRPRRRGFSLGVQCDLGDEWAEVGGECWEGLAVVFGDECLFRRSWQARVRRFPSRTR